MKKDYQKDNLSIILNHWMVFPVKLMMQKIYLKNEFGPAIANAKKNGWIEIYENRILLKGYHDITSEEKIIKTIASKNLTGISTDDLNDKNALDSLKKRPDFIIL